MAEIRISRFGSRPAATCPQVSHDPNFPVANPLPMLHKTGMSGEIAFAMYRPFAATSRKALLELIQQHNTTLRVEELITDRPALLAESEDGTFIEIFEWKPGAAAKAHDHKAVQKLWKRLEELAEFSALISLPESERPFPHFKPVDGVVT